MKRQRSRLPKVAPWMPGKPETPIVIRVTPEDIALGHEGESCPVARAMAREAGLLNPQVIPGGYRVVGARYNWKLPTHVWTWVRRLDAGKPVEPFTFEWWPVN